MPGSNLSYTRRKLSVWPKILKLLNCSNGGFAVNGKLCTKAGAPTTDAADDQPNAVGDICLDTTNDDVYISTENVSSGQHTWVQITP